MAPAMLPHLVRRPITMERYPAGIGKKGFWQKDVSKGFPGWLERVKVPKKDGVVHHPVVTDTRSLMWITQVEDADVRMVEVGRAGGPSWVKTSGSKGFHLIVPIDGKATTDDATQFAHDVGRLFVSHAPKHLTQEFDVWADLPTKRRSLARPRTTLRRLLG